jgi:flagellar basal body-associated protein FliL
MEIIMKKHKTLILYPLLLVLVTAACGPAVQQTVPTATATQVVAYPVTTQPAIEPTSGSIATETNQSEPMVQPTSRGPNLEASDPSTVNLASGQLQLVEFFRFT